MRKHLTILGLLVVMAFALMMFAGCAEKQAVVKDEGVQQTATPQTDDEAARLAKEKAERDAADRAKAAKDAADQAATTAVELTIQSIYFDFDKSSIRDDARDILKVNADIFNKKNTAGIVVEGHCDERGTAEYNMALGERRAQEAKKYLVNLGVNASRIETVSYGKEKPVDPGHDEAAWAKNRRAEFLLK